MPDPMFKAILAQVRRIPRGKVATYGDVAYAAGFPGAARQVVWALHSTQGLPWHRVVGAGGQIRLTGEHGFEQRMRLQSEGVQFRGRRIDMDQHHHSFYSRAKSAGPKKQSPTHTKAKKRSLTKPARPGSRKRV